MGVYSRRSTVDHCRHDVPYTKPNRMAWSVRQVSISPKNLPTQERVMEAWSAIMAGVVTTVTIIIGYLKVRDGMRFTSIEEQLVNARNEHAECQKRLAALTAEVKLLREAKINAVVVADKDGKIVDWSIGATTLFHYRYDEAVGKNVHILTPPRYRRRHDDAFKGAVEDGKVTSNPIEAMGITREGEEVPVTIKLESWIENGELRIAADIKRRE